MGRTFTTEITMGLLMAALMLLSSVLITEEETYAQTTFQDTSEILSDAVEDLRESGEFNEEADLNAEAIDQGTAPEEEEEEQTTSPVPTTPVPNTQTGGGTYQITNEDSFRVQIPEGWIIQDIVPNPNLLELEATRGYGELARLCPEIEQHEAALLNEGGSTTGTSSTDDVCIFDLDRILIIRYPDLETRLGTTDNFLTYSLQKLQELSYTNIQIVNSTDTTVNIINPQTNETVATAPANFTEITYSPGYAQHETRRAYLISATTDATAPNVGTTKGYIVFYVGNSATTATSATASEITTTADDTGLPLPPAVKQVFDSFELIAASATSSAPTPTTPDTTTTTTAEVPEDYIEFRSPVFGVVISYPPDWEVRPPSDTVRGFSLFQAFAPEGEEGEFTGDRPNLNLEVAEERGAMDAAAARAWLEERAFRLMTQHDRFEITQSAPVQIAGREGWMITADFTSLLDGEDYITTNYMVGVGGRTYLITYHSPVEWYEEYLPAAQNMIASFRVE